MPVLFPVFTNTTAEMNLIDAVGARDEPDLSAGKPDVGKFHLHSVHDHLLEKTVFIAEGKARGGVIERRERIHKTGGETTQTAVAESRVGFTFIEIFQRETERFQRLFVGRGEAEVAKIGFERATEQKFHAHIINALGARRVDLLFIGGSLFRKKIFHGDRRRFVHLLARRFRRRATEMALENVFQ